VQTAKLLDSICVCAQEVTVTLNGCFFSSEGTAKPQTHILQKDLSAQTRGGKEEQRHREENTRSILCIGELLPFTNNIARC
jgi:hypothetical protein